MYTTMFDNKCVQLDKHLHSKKIDIFILKIYTFITL